MKELLWKLDRAAVDLLERAAGVVLKRAAVEIEGRISGRRSRN